jgi:protein phosphatase
VDEGRISEEEASSHPQKSVVTRVMDGREDVELDLSVREVRVGDRFLVCSDGLTGPVGSLETLRDALLLPDPQESVDRLVQLALRGGGPDNVTAIVADVVDSDGKGMPPVVAGAAAESPQEAPPGIADSPASRARVAEGRDAAPAVRGRTSVAPNKPPNKHGKALAWTLAVLLVLAAGAAAGFVYIRSQYYVGFDANDVVVFRGVEGHLAGLSFSTVADKSTLTRDQLSSLEAERVDDGIPATDEKNARAIVERLIAQTQCNTTPTPSPTVSSLGTARPAATPRPNPAATPSPTTAPTTAPTPAPTASASEC